MLPLTSIHANPLRRRTVLCTGCNTSVYPTGRRWKPISQLCLACDTKKNNADALTGAQHGETVDDDDPEHRATAVRLTIRFPPRRLCTEVVLGKGAHVMITRNLWQRKGIVNATVGTVEDIIWGCGAESSDLPLAVLVSCKDYKGPTLWRTEARERFPLGIPVVPIVPLKTSFESQSQSMARTQLPLPLA